ncbi:MAG: histidine triad nucleotide-binding protein [Nautiliaceae bacterium]
MDCIFCKIVKGEIPSKKVLENEKFLAFYDINPSAPVHILIIPKEHYENFSTTPSEIFCEMSEFTKEVAKEIKVKDYRLITNNGRSAGQEIFHFHIHLLSNPNGKLKWPKLV